MMSGSIQDDSANYRKLIDQFYLKVRDQIIKYQHPITGLFKLHPDNDQCDLSHVRDSVYCATVMFALYQCYKKLDDTKGRSFELGKRTSKCMRSILVAWMSQCNKMEEFKAVQSPENSLHSVFSYSDGYPINHLHYQHLQVDCVSLFLIQLVQMTHAGIEIIFTKDEVVFVQNLIFYIERAYRIPDFGMWERGTKQNNGTTELSASSIGMAKAALEAATGFNLFGQEGDYSTVLFVDFDAHCRNRIILANLLPRMSASKSQDMAMVPMITWPSFASHRKDLQDMIFAKMKQRFEGNYGYRRFTRDGYMTLVEDGTRQHYRLGEMKIFEDIENEWPMFFAYFLIHLLMCQKTSIQSTDEIQELNTKLSKLLRTVPGEKYKWLPKYYAVPEGLLDAERDRRCSQKRISSIDLGETRFLWGQAVYLISQMLHQGALSPSDLDPIGRRLAASERYSHRNIRYSSIVSKPADLMVQVVLISESVRLQQMLATYGIQSETPRQVEPILIWPPENLKELGEYLGACERLGLKGRPKRPYGQLGTSKYYRIGGATILCYPLLFEAEEFYLPYDMNNVIDGLNFDLKFLSTWWRMRGRPTFVIFLKENMIQGPWMNLLIQFLTSLKTGNVSGVRVLLGRAQNFMASGCIEHLDYLHGKVDCLADLPRIQELDVDKSFQVFFNEPGQSTPRRKLSAVAQGSTADGFYNCVEIPEDEHVFDNWGTEELIESLVSMETLDNTRDARLLQTQSYKLFTLLSRMGMGCVLRRGESECSIPRLLSVLSARAGVLQLWSIVRFCASLMHKMPNSLAPALSTIIVSGKQITVGVPGFEECLIDKPITPKEICRLVYDYVYPHDIRLAVLQQELILVISSLIMDNKPLFEGIHRIRIGWLTEAMKYELQYTDKSERMLYWLSPTEIKALMQETLRQNVVRNPLWFRQISGCLNRVPTDFYPRMYKLVERSPGIRFLHGMLERQILSDLSRNDTNFIYRFESMLQQFGDPAHRQLMVEALMIVSVITDRNPEVEILEPIDMCQIVNTAWDEFQRDHKRIERSDNMTPFFSAPMGTKVGTSSYLARSVINTLLKGEFSFTREDCAIQ